jgi:hypothetical protein
MIYRTLVITPPGDQTHDLPHTSHYTIGDQTHDLPHTSHYTTRDQTHDLPHTSNYTTDAHENLFVYFTKVHTIIYQKKYNKKNGHCPFFLYQQWICFRHRCKFDILP